MKKLKYHKPVLEKKRVAVRFFPKNRMGAYELDKSRSGLTLLAYAVC